MAKAKNEEEQGGMDSASSPPADQAEGREGVRLVTVLYSPHRDVYKVPSFGVDLWLSVQVYDLANWGSHVAAAKTADGKAWRRAYRNWSIIRPGDAATIPASDPMVLDYAAGVTSP